LVIKIAGMPGTSITIRGENLGNDPRYCFVLTTSNTFSDLVALIVCGTDCLLTSKWVSSSKIVARLGNAKRGLGDVIIVTKSGGRGISNVQFRVFIEQVGPLAESSVWVDEVAFTFVLISMKLQSRTVPCRSVVRNVDEVTESRDALGLKKSLTAE
jgi:hypothetical protein